MQHPGKKIWGREAQSDGLGLTYLADRRLVQVGAPVDRERAGNSFTKRVYSGALLLLCAHLTGNRHRIVPAGLRRVSR